MSITEDRRVRRSRNQIKVAFTTLLQSEAIDKITVKQLCDTSDIARKTFYLHYVDKYALVDEFIDNLFDQLTAICTDVDDDVFMAKTTLWLTFFDDHRRFINQLLASSAAESFRQRFLTFVETQIANKSTWRDNAILSRDAVTLRFLATGVIGVITQYLADSTMDKLVVARRLTAILLRNLEVKGDVSAESRLI